MENIDRFRFRVWDKTIRKYLDFMCLFDDGQIGRETEIRNSRYNNDAVVIEFSTGLRDKNGKLIYEGDLLKSDIFRNDYLAFCEKCKSIQPHSLDKEIGCYSCNNDLFFADILEDIDNIEIIGNKFSNPELLKGE